MDDKDKTLRRILALTVLVQKVVSQAVLVQIDGTAPEEYSKQRLAEALGNLTRLATEWTEQITPK